MTPEQITELQEKLAAAEAKAKQMDELEALLSTPEGLQAFDREVKARLGNPTPAPAPAEVDFRTMDEMEFRKFILDHLTNEATTRNKGLEEIKNLITKQSKTTEVERVANLGVAKVKEDLGIDITPQQLVKVMTETDITDPVKAVMLAMSDQVVTKLKQPAPVEKPNHATSIQELDFEKMTTAERFQLLRDNPELAADMQKNTVRTIKTEEAPADQNTSSSEE